MARALTDIRSLARAHTEKAINVLAGIMQQESAPEAARVAAANSLLDRGWGKPTQAIVGSNDDPPVRFEGNLGKFSPDQLRALRDVFRGLEPSGD